MAVFVITGARAGIGLEYVRQLSSNSSYTLVALVRSITSEIAALNGMKGNKRGAMIHILECDVASETSISALPSSLAGALGPDFKVDYLINNAGILHSKAETSLNIRSDWLLSHITGNVLGPAKIVEVLVPHLAPGAKIANLSSGAGSLSLTSNGDLGGATMTGYSISKAALNMLTVHQAIHLAGKAIVVVISPGWVKTDMGGEDATLTVEDSARGILATVVGLKPEDNGKFFLYDGSKISW